MSGVRTPSDSTQSRTLAIAVDVVAGAALFLTAAAIHTGQASVRLGFVRISANTIWRPIVAALVALGVRAVLVKNPRPFAWIFENIHRTFPADERRLFDDDVTSRQFAIGALWVIAAFFALTAVMTWPQVRDLYAVHDFGDPLFSVWRLAWVNHQILRDPVHLFDANIFYPERLTLTYSDAMIVPALTAAPLFWAGVHPVVIHNVLLLSGFALSGASMFLLVRALTGRLDAAAVAGVVFTVYPYRYEHYPHLELQMTMWTPLALWALHRTLARGRIKDGLTTGLLFALQTLSSLYYGCFLAVYLTVVGGAMWLGRGRPARPLPALAAGAALAGVLIAPVAAAYVASRPAMGDRDIGTIEAYSAQGADYLMPTIESHWYGAYGHQAEPERALFPRVMPVLLAAAAVWPPLSIARIAYVLGLVVAVDGSLGLNGPTFTWLHDHLLPFRGLRVPARFSLLVGMTLSILAGYGATRIVQSRPGLGKTAVAAVLVALVLFEARTDLRLREPWLAPPPIYGSLSPASPAVLAEFPMPADDLHSDFDARYLYFSTFHWQTLVNGNSGFFPPSYKELLARESDFPADDAIAYLRQRGVQYLTFHGAFTTSERAQKTIGMLDRHPELELVTRADWDGSESRLYRFRR